MHTTRCLNWTGYRSPHMAFSLRPILFKSSPKTSVSHVRLFVSMQPAMRTLRNNECEYAYSKGLNPKAVAITRMNNTLVLRTYATHTTTAQERNSTPKPSFVQTLARWIARSTSFLFYCAVVGAGVGFTVCPILFFFWYQWQVTYQQLGSGRILLRDNSPTPEQRNPATE